MSVPIALPRRRSESHACGSCGKPLVEGNDRAAYCLNDECERFGLDISQSETRCVECKWAKSGAILRCVNPRQRGWADRIGAVLVFAGQSAPVFFTGIVLILVFGVRLGWLPISGKGGPETLIMPALALGVHSAAYTTRLLRGALLEVLGQDYMRTAAAKGLRERVVVVKHSLKNALIPVITVLGIQVAQILGGTVIFESIFGLPGMGRFLFDAINQRDYPVIQGVNLLIVSVVVLMNLIVDAFYAFLDPRIRY